MADTVRGSQFEETGWITASYVVAETQPSDERDELLRRADQAPQRAKSTGGDRVETV
ncbi:hypothetical protein [Thiohalorhabdus sp.]|uniref:hypothetical protein n=1 Tax=Thiohalorhabdus sp. TaxID=3094134 RepID=UPI002FC32D7E